MTAFLSLCLFFIGISIGTLNPYPKESLWSWLIPLIIATIFMIFDYYYDRKGGKT